MTGGYKEWRSLRSAPSSTQRPTLANRLANIAFDVAVETREATRLTELVEGRLVDKAKPDFYVLQVRIAELGTFGNDSQ